MSHDIVRIHPDGRREPLDVPASITEWAALVGAFVEVDPAAGGSRRADGSILLFDADHESTGATDNAAASMLAGRPIAGPVLHVTGAAADDYRRHVRIARAAAGEHERR